jgi:hypothetical protein
MNIKTFVILALAVASTVPLSAYGKKKDQPVRGMLEKMEAVPCGAKQRGLTGLGSVWASAGITHVNSDEKLCPEYLLRTDEMEYHIRPMDAKHDVVLSVGHEGEFTVKNDRMFLKVDDGDRKTRTYRVVSANPTNATSEGQSSKSQEDTDKP